MQVPPRLLMGPGPSNSHPRVLVAQGLPTLGTSWDIPLCMIRSASKPLYVVFNLNHLHFSLSLQDVPGAGGVNSSGNATVLLIAGHLHPPFLAILDEIKAGLRYMFQTESPYTCLISGTGAIPCGLKTCNNSCMRHHEHCTEQETQGYARGWSTPNVRSTGVTAHTGHAGMEAAVANLCEPGETILIINTGIWGVRAAELSRRYGGVRLPAMHHMSRMQL